METTTYTGAQISSHSAQLDKNLPAVAQRVVEQESIPAVAHPSDDTAQPNGISSKNKRYKYTEEENKKIITWKETENRSWEYVAEKLERRAKAISEHYRQYLRGNGSQRPAIADHLVFELPAADIIATPRGCLMHSPLEEIDLLDESTSFGTSPSDPDLSSDDDGCSSEDGQGRSSTSKHSRWSDLDKQRLLAYKKEGKPWEWIFGKFPGRTRPAIRAGTWSGLEASRLPPAGG